MMLVYYCPYEDKAIEDVVVVEGTERVMFSGTSGGSGLGRSFEMHSQVAPAFATTSTPTADFRSFVGSSANSKQKQTSTDSELCSRTKATVCVCRIAWK